MKFARMRQMYKYNPASWNLEGNIGDCIQNIAIENLYKKLGITDLIQINRDDLINYHGEKAILPMQGWFGNLHDSFLASWSKDIIPIFIGFHLNDAMNCRDVFVEKDLHNKIKNYEPIGCRDRSTRDFLSRLGIETYFSACATLTLPKRTKEPKDGKIFLVDLSPKAMDIIPKKIRQQADESITHIYQFTKYPLSEEEVADYENYTKKILERYYNEAKLVITSRIHSAMPCIAMGIPVIFIHSKLKDSRLDVLDGIIPKYSPNDKYAINWNPKAPNIEKMKEQIINNVLYQICKCAKNNGVEIKTDTEYKNNLHEMQKLDAELEKKEFINKLKLFPSRFIFGTIGAIRDFVSYQSAQFKLLKNIRRHKTVILWGASLYLEKFLKRYKIKNKNIVGIVDKNYEKHFQKLGEYTIYPPEKIAELNADTIICTIKNHHEKVYPQVKKYIEENFPDKTILPDIF